MRRDLIDLAIVSPLNFSVSVGVTFRKPGVITQCCSVNYDRKNSHKHPRFCVHSACRGSVGWQDGKEEINKNTIKQVLERWQSGRLCGTGNAVFWETGTGGSNPPLSAENSICYSAPHQNFFKPLRYHWRRTISRTIQEVICPFRAQSSTTGNQWKIPEGIRLFQLFGI